jgi:DNA topoisomerase-1
VPDGAEEGIQVFDGPYGLYVKQGKVNASLPEGATADTLTLEQAVELLAAKAASSTTKGRGKASGSSKASGTGKTGSSRATKPSSSSSATAASTARKPPATTKTGRLRASSVRVIKPAGS